MKGVVLANCGQLGLDPDRTSLSGYIETLNAGDAQGGGHEVSAGLKRFMAAHQVNDNA